MSQEGRALLAAAIRARRKASDRQLLDRTFEFARSMVRVGEFDTMAAAVADAAKYTLYGVGGARKERLMVALKEGA